MKKSNVDVSDLLQEMHDKRNQIQVLLIKLRKAVWTNDRELATKYLDRIQELL